MLRLRRLVGRNLRFFLAAASGLASLLASATGAVATYLNECHRLVRVVNTTECFVGITATVACSAALGVAIWTGLMLARAGASPAKILARLPWVPAGTLVGLLPLYAWKVCSHGPLPEWPGAFWDLLVPEFFCMVWITCTLTVMLGFVVGWMVSAMIAGFMIGSGRWEHTALT